MKREFSIYLDLVRFLAAMVVFLGHVSGHRFTGGRLWQFGAFMDVAVMVFFVLSGYVIAWVADTREGTGFDFFTARAARMYSVAIPAIIIAAILDPIGVRLDPGIYFLHPAWGYDGRHDWLQVLAYLSFTHQLWNNDIVFGSLLPYWSLGYEVWYYIIFGLALFNRGWKRWTLAALACLVVGPKILALFPIWLAGALAYRVVKRDGIGRLSGYALFLSSAVLAVLLFWALRGQSLAGLPADRQLLIERYAEAGIFVMHILGVQAICADFNPVLLFARVPIRYLAGMTFSIYLFHLPIAQFLAAISPFPVQSLIQWLLVEGGTFLLILAASHITERRKDLWHNAIDWAFRRWPIVPAPG
jgi:peptidoglycan/LPS O-acetylase OafA/YrhL